MQTKFVIIAFSLVQYCVLASSEFPNKYHLNNLEFNNDDYEQGYHYGDEKDELNKRLPKYSFGLGKRNLKPSELMQAYGEGMDIPEYIGYLNGRRPYIGETGYGLTLDGKNALHYGNMPPVVRRSRPYSFGLGKRDDNEDKLPSGRYNFGIGRR